MSVIKPQFVIVFILLTLMIFTISACKHPRGSGVSSFQAGNHAASIKNPAETTLYSRFFKKHNYTAAEQRGLLLWYKATAGTEQFHNGPYISRVGVLPNWNDVFGIYRDDVKMQKGTNGARETRFDKWGLINDPDCRSAKEGGV